MFTNRTLVAGLLVAVALAMSSLGAGQVHAEEVGTYGPFDTAADARQFAKDVFDSFPDVISYGAPDDDDPIKAPYYAGITWQTTAIPIRWHRNGDTYETNGTKR